MSSISHFYIFVWHSLGQETELYGGNAPSLHTERERQTSWLQSINECALDCKVKYLAEIMVLILVNLSLKQMLVSDLTSQRVSSLGLDVIGSKENMKFLLNNFPKDKNQFSG